MNTLFIISMALGIAGSIAYLVDTMLVYKNSKKGYNYTTNENICK